MLSEDEQRFFAYWQKNREDEARFSRKLLRGIPSALIFAVPILLLLIVIYMFLPEWYSKFGFQLQSNIAVIIVALCIIVVFVGYFKMHFRWEEYEQKYLELKHKIDRQAAEK